jgi:hypothetical protein
MKRSKKMRNFIVCGVAFVLCCFVAQVYSVPVTSNLILQLDDSDITDVDGYVTSWNDQSTCGHDLSADSDSARPTLVQNGLNGYDTVSFVSEGTTDQLVRAEVDSSQFKPLTGGLTIFMVAKFDNLGSAPTYLFRNGNSATAVDGWSIWVSEAEGLWGRLNSGGINDNDHKAASLRTPVQDEWFIYCYTVDGSKVTTALNGDATGDIRPWGGTYTGSIGSADDLRLGYLTDMEVAEVLVYKNCLSELDQNQVGYYLESKYAIDTAYTPEPATILLLGLGMAFLRNRKR